MTFNKSAYMKCYRLEHPEVMQRFLDTHPDYMKNYCKISNKKWRPINSKKTINPRGQGQIYLKENPRRGQCLKCGKKIGDSCVNWKGEIATIKQTQLHHLKYDYSDILKHTVELCVPCHRREHVGYRYKT